MEYIYLNITNSAEVVIYDKLPVSTAPITSDYEGASSAYVKSSSSYAAIQSLALCNIHASDSVTIDLYARFTQINQSNDVNRGQYNEDNTLDVIDDTVIDYYLLKNVVIPKGVTLKLTEEEMCYDNKYYDLYLKLSAADSAVDVAIKHY
tara:strand:- start:11953 stop:12399 length:447 start_codon:yes stop_codon:yes gene_type:complete